MNEDNAIKVIESFHLNNWKKLLYTRGEVDKGICEGQQVNENANSATSYTSRWSWPWKIELGKVISSEENISIDCDTWVDDVKQTKIVFHRQNIPLPKYHRKIA